MVAAVGQCLIQLAHASGYKIVTTASPRNFDLVKALGADVVIDMVGQTHWERNIKAMAVDGRMTILAFMSGM